MEGEEGKIVEGGRVGVEYNELDDLLVVRLFSGVLGVEEFLRSLWGYWGFVV